MNGFKDIVGFEATRKDHRAAHLLNQHLAILPIMNSPSPPKFFNFRIGPPAIQENGVNVILYLLRHVDDFWTFDMKDLNNLECWQGLANLPVTVSAYHVDNLQG